MAFIDRLTGKDDLLQEFFQHKRFWKCVLREYEDKLISSATSSIEALLCYKIVNFAEHKMVEENNDVASCGHCESNHSLDFNVNSCGQDVSSAVPVKIVESQNIIRISMMIEVVICSVLVTISMEKSQWRCS